MKKEYVQLTIEQSERLKAAKKRKKITWEQLAEEIDSHKVHLQNLASGRNKADIEIFIRLCVALDVEPDFILRGTKKRISPSWRDDSELSPEQIENRKRIAKTVQRSIYNYGLRRGNVERLLRDIGVNIDRTDNGVICSFVEEDKTLAGEIIERNVEYTLGNDTYYLFMNAFHSMAVSAVRNLIPALSLMSAELDNTIELQKELEIERSLRKDLERRLDSIS